MRKHTFYFILIFLSVVTFASCSKSKINTSTNIITLVDFSKSIPPSTLDWYKEVIKNSIIANLGEKDKITVLPIDYGSQTSSSEIFISDFEKQHFRKEFDSPLQQKTIVKRRLKIYKDSIEVLFDSAFSKAKNDRVKYSLGTDIIGGFTQANKYFIPGQNNLIVTFSDMIQETEQLNLNKNLSTEKDINLLLKKIQFPNYNKLDVFIMTGEQPKIKIKKYKLLKKFWSSYFSKTNLNLIQYESGGENILVNKINSYKLDKGD
ncbi:MAG TPA: hypothetical protein ENI61_01380 [Ignavibacteria bacterium]|nr:hypothetical protein [Ignavibacteria bacterium]